ncbi:hypothetical protein H0H92_013245 [Tricholoma furcatifolium]|nr:hypothetical protein H0H92_013245 [Tricholoma furcatifolium]
MSQEARGLAWPTQAAMQRRLAEKTLLADIAPFYNQTKGTDEHELLLFAFYSIWWHRFPLDPKDFDNDLDLVEFVRDLRNRKVRRELMWAASRTKIITLIPWQEYVSVEEDEKRQRALLASWERQPRPKPRPIKSGNQSEAPAQQYATSDAQANSGSDVEDDDASATSDGESSDESEIDVDEEGVDDSQSESLIEDED